MRTKRSKSIHRLNDEDGYSKKKRKTRKLRVLKARKKSWSNSNIGSSSSSSDATPHESHGFSIDDDDYQVVRQILSTAGMEGDNEIEAKAQDVVKIRDDDPERRVHKLGIAGNIRHVLSLPDSMGRLTHLTHLYIHCANITSLPASIGELHNLQELGLGWTHKLSELPPEVGNLTKLTKLTLRCSFEIASLPASIGKLKQLRELDLSETMKLFELPDEIGSLSSLTKLDLRWSNINRLPKTIGNLKNLVSLNLSETKKLVGLPEELGKLSRLQVLELSWSKIRSLPDSIRKLSSLRYLNLCRTHIPELHHEDERNDLLFDLVDHCLALGSLDLYVEEGREELDFALACNRARTRTGFGIRSRLQSAGGEGSKPFSPNLWPHLIKGASRAFGRYPNFQWIRCAEYKMKQPDAIYQLLLDGRESFVGALVNRSSGDSCRKSNKGFASPPTSDPPEIASTKRRALTSLEKEYLSNL